MTRFDTSHGIVIHTVIAGKSDVALGIYLYRIKGTYGNAIHTPSTLLQIDIHRPIRAPDNRVILTRLNTLRLLTILAHQNVRLILLYRDADATTRHRRFGESAQ